MQPIMIASLLFHELPFVISIFSPALGMTLGSSFQYATWYPALYGLVVFLAACAEMGDTTPKQMTDYLNAVMLMYPCKGVMWVLMCSDRFYALLVTDSSGQRVRLQYVDACLA